jgi:hypothetical protein
MKPAELVDQHLVVDPHRRAEQRRSKRPVAVPALLTFVDEVVDSVYQTLQDITPKEGVVACVRAHGEGVVELIRQHRLAPVIIAHEYKGRTGPFRGGLSSTAARLLLPA